MYCLTIDLVSDEECKGLRSDIGIFINIPLTIKKLIF